MFTCKKFKFFRLPRDDGIGPLSWLLFRNLKGGFGIETIVFNYYKIWLKVNQQSNSSYVLGSSCVITRKFYFQIPPTSVKINTWVIPHHHSQFFQVYEVSQGCWDGATKLVVI